MTALTPSAASPAITTATRVAAAANRITHAAALTDVTISALILGPRFITIQGADDTTGLHLTYDQGARFLSDGLHLSWTDGTAYQSTHDGQWLRSLVANLDGYRLTVTVSAHAPTGSHQ